MKQLIIILIAGLALNACQGSADRRSETAADERPAVQVAPENLASISFDVEGMTCTGCENSVKSSLESIHGVVEAHASHETGITTVKYDKTLVSASEMEEGIRSRGYKVRGQLTGE